MTGKVKLYRQVGLREFCSIASESLSEDKFGWFEETSAISPDRTVRLELSLRLLLSFRLDRSMGFANLAATFT